MYTHAGPMDTEEEEEEEGKIEHTEKSRALTGTHSAVTDKLFLLFFSKR